MTVTTTGSVATTTARLSAGEAAAYLALVQAQAAARRQLTQAAVDAVFAALTGFGAGGWWDAAQITKLTQQILKQVQPAQKRAARLTDSYVARMVSKTRGKTVRPVGAVDVTQLRRKLPQNIIEDLAHDRLDVPWLEIGDTEDGPNRDIDAEMPSLLGDKDEPEYRDPADVYGRLADKYRWEVVTQGASHEEALEKVKVRAEAAVDTDIALAVREQETWTARKLGVQFYRRVLHPELAESGLSCGLCIVASDRIYSVAKFKRELHDHCHCEMIPVENGKDPGLTLNEDDLESLYRAAGKAVGRERETSGAAKQLGALKRVRVGITEHGELGPILVKIGTTSGGQVLAKDADEARVGKSRGRRGGDPPGGFRTIKDYAKTQTQDPAIRAAAQLVTLERTLAVLEEKVAGGMKKEERSLGERKVTVDLESALKWQREQVARLRKIANG
jgi:hypothetical protein